MQMARLALKSLWRDLRAADVRALFLAMIIAVAATTMIGFFLDRVTQGMARQAGQLLGGDVVLVKGAPFEQADVTRLREGGFKTSEQTQMVSMASRQGAFQLSSLKTVDHDYPLYGTLTIRTAAGEVQKTGPPAVGEVWIDARLGRRLEAGLGDEFQLGQTRVRVAGFIEREPDQRVGLANLNPHILLSQATLESADLIHPGARVTYRLMGRGESGAVEAIQPWLDSLRDQSIRVMDVEHDSPRLGRTLERTQKYLSLAGLAAVLLAGVAVAMATRRYVERHLMTVALLRCFGSQRRQFTALFLYQLGWLALMASVLGAALGWLGQEALLSLLAAMLTLALPPPGIMPLALGVLTAVAMLAGFAGPTLLRLKNVSALKVLRHELDPMPVSALWVVLVASLVFGALLWLFSKDLMLSFWVLVLGFLALFGLWAVSAVLLRGLGRLSYRFHGPWRMGARQLAQRTRSSQGQMVAFSVTLAAVGFITLVRADLLDDWQNRLPADAPNQFAINIQPSERADFTNALDALTTSRSDVYPLVRGRIVAINDRPPRQVVPEEAREDGNLRRELNLTWREALPDTNDVTQGQWFAPDAGAGEGVVPISMAERLATRFDLSLGDTLTFDIGGSDVTGRITSIRKVDWESFKPNFFVIFPPNVLEGFSHSFITAFYLPSDKRDALGQVVKQFPSVSFLDIGVILNEVDRMLSQVARAILFILLFVGAAGVAVLFAALAASRPERTHEGALLRVFGAQSGYLSKAHGAEFLWLGGLSGVMAAVLVEGGTAALYAFWLDLPVRAHPLLWVGLPGVGMALVGGLGWVLGRDLRRQPPMTSLSQLEQS
ncbi:ABC transporter permease [Larsenimonas salina]|uniref:ABC transporter permease n=1 Tax=Larsenimonas salina TaxID=1295565 RepID=UPI0032EE72EB